MKMKKQGIDQEKKYLQIHTPKELVPRIYSDVILQFNIRQNNSTKT